MRLDKFLKLSRLIKRRTLASELCRLGGVKRNGKVAKASAVVEIGDELELQFGNRFVQGRILELPLKAAGNLTEAARYVEIIVEERVSPNPALPLDDEDTP
jgi:ribosomal 50S subunit-recycling heat shock protein